VGQVTLSTRAFGRGTDFISRDTVLDGIGGLHVVQAFFSEMLSEEIQVMGRTARQGQKGLYSMVLLQQDTLLVDSDGKNQPKPDTLEYFGVTDAELQRVARQDRYTFLSQKRDLKRSVEVGLIEVNLKIATERDRLSRAYFQSLLSRDPRAASKFEHLYTSFKAMQDDGTGLSQAVRDNSVKDTLHNSESILSTYSNITINQLDPFEVDGNDNWYKYSIDVADVLLWRNAQHFSLAGLAEHLFSQPITITVSVGAAEKVREHLLASDSLTSGLVVTVMPYYNLCDATVWERTLSATIIFEPSGVIFDSSGENFGGIQIVLPSYVSLCGQSGDDDVQAHQQQARVLKTKKEFDEEVNEMADGSYPSFARKLWEVSDEDHNIAVVLHEDRHVTFKLDIHHFSGVTVISSLLATAFGVALIVSHTSNDWTWVSPQIPADQVGFYGEHAKSARQKILEDIYLQNRRVTRTPRAILEDCLRSLCHQLNPGDVCAFDNLMHEYAAKCRKLNRSCGRHKMEYDCFLSYRHASDKVTVDRVHDKLTLCFPNINIYYDKTEMQGILKKSFLQALAKCRVFVPIISCAAMQGHRLRSDATDPVDPLTQRHRVKDDNVLLEIETALALHEVYNNYSDVENGASNVVFVMPLIINDWVNTTDYDNNPH